MAETRGTPLRVGNASGFYGDRFGAVREMLEGGPLDILTGDYLAELTMLILGRDRLSDPSRGYARTFLRQMEECLGLAMERGTRVVTNAGGLNPAGLATALAELAERLGVTVRVAHVEGDDVLNRVTELDLSTTDGTDPLTANAYLGGWGITECLDAGAGVVVTGRVADAALVSGAAAAHFGWRPDNWDALAGATVAGHVLECGTHATGGNYAFFREIDKWPPGFPIAEIQPDGSSEITKHPGTGGAVTVDTVTAQLVYEIERPAYPGPDVTSHFDTASLAQRGEDRVAISGVRGSPPPNNLKVCLNHLAGHRNSTTFVLTGTDLPGKARLVRRQLESAIGSSGLTWRLTTMDGSCDDPEEADSALLHVTIQDRDGDRAGKAFSRAAVELALGSYPGFHLTAPPDAGSPYGVYTPATVPREAVRHTAVLPDGTRSSVVEPPECADPLWSAPEPIAPECSADTVVTNLGTVLGARSGDKGGDANLGVWARSDPAHRWMVGYLTVERLRELLPKLAGLEVERYELPNLRAVNFVVRGLLGRGVSAGTGFDPQAKALGEWLRSRPAEVPAALVDDLGALRFMPADQRAARTRTEPEEW